MSNKRGLGRGLSALIPSTQDAVGAENELPIHTISPNPKQPRTAMDDEGIAELADSVRKVGILQPILVRPHGDGYQIVAGERRWRAAKEAGLENVPVRIRNMSETEALQFALIENLQREDLNPMEEARGYKRLLSEHQMTQAELADKVSKSRSAVTNALRLLDLPDDVQTMLYECKLSAGHGRAILGVPDDMARAALATKVAEQGLSVRETENLARLYAAGQAERAHREPAPKSFKVVARKLRRLLGTGVRVRQTAAKGKIEIDFHGEDDLERVFRLLAGGEAMREGDAP